MSLELDSSYRFEKQDDKNSYLIFSIVGESKSGHSINAGDPSAGEPKAGDPGPTPTNSKKHRLHLVDFIAILS